MRILGKIELLCGLLAGLLGVLGMAYATFGPTYRNSEGGTATLLQINGPGALTPVLFLTLLSIAIGVGAYLHARRRRISGLTLLWGAEILLALARVITGFSIGIFLQPAAALGLISSVAGSLAARNPIRGIAIGLGILWAASSLLYFIALTPGDGLARVGQAMISGPLFLLALLFDPRQLLPLLG